MSWLDTVLIREKRQRSRSASPSNSDLTLPEKRPKLVTSIPGLPSTNEECTSLHLLAGVPIARLGASHSHPVHRSRYSFRVLRLKLFAAQGLATRFGIHELMLRINDWLKTPRRHYEQCMPGTRTQLINDIVSWILNPYRTANVLEIVGIDSAMVLCTVYQIIKHWKPTVFLSDWACDEIRSEYYASRIPALISLMIATHNKELADYLEAHSSLEQETLFDPQSLSNFFLPNFYASRSTQSSPIIMLNAEIVDFSPEVLQMISGAQVDPPIPILWLISSGKPNSFYQGPLVSLSLPPVTRAEKEIILHHIVARDTVDCFLFDVDSADSCAAYAECDISALMWEINGMALWNTNTGYILAFAELENALNQGREQSNLIEVGEHLSSGQYLPLVSLASNCDLGTEQFALLIVLVMQRTVADWADYTAGFFLNAFDVFKNGKLDIVTLADSRCFKLLFPKWGRDSEHSHFMLGSAAYINYLERELRFLTQPVSDLALVPPLMFAYLSALESRAIDRVLFAIMHFDFDSIQFRSSIVYLYDDIHNDLWKTLPTITFWDDPDFLKHFGSALPCMRFHTHSIPVDDFLEFVFHFREHKVSKGFVRVQASSSFDQDLIDACGSMAGPLDFECDSYEEFSDFSDDGEAGYTLLGFPTDPVLCIVVDEAVTIYTHAELAELL
ncbi:hypothetical protein NP233_g7683 [Leucocoprinus birnbaumii]|uniref:Uncharacterized protein n=1 Tax=Leucocoprinus birnbaumii TaxID=56174 RepID=A0AAD5VS41_9AGAR|nr:hypothetical protein NP233_g7683 [Leucocoprinus birnbaumii]